MLDLSSRHEEVLAAAERQGLLVFPAYVGDDLPAIWWQGDPEAWPDFLGITKAEGQRILFVGRAVLDTEDLQELAEQHEETRGSRPTNGDRARIKAFERYVGYTGEVQMAYIKDGVAFILQQRTEWYEDFLDLLDETEDAEE
jgi:hypothetical protein